MVFVKINDTPYQLKLGLNDLVAFEKVTGKSMMVENMEMSLEDMRLLFYLALKGGNRKYDGDVETAGELVDALIQEEGMENFSDVLGDVFENFMGKPKQTGNQKESLFRKRK